MTIERTIIVDGYNVIYALDSLKHLMPANKERARESLAIMLQSIYSIESVRIMLVFDSAFDRIKIEYPLGDKSFEFIFAPQYLTADGVIERIIVRIHNKASVTVVSNDNLVRESTRSNGAMAMRPIELFEWIANCNKRLTEKKQISKDNRKDLENRIELDFNLEDL